MAGGEELEGCMRELVEWGFDEKLVSDCGKGRLEYWGSKLL